MKIALLIICGVLYGLVALLMLGAVLLQESKGGGLAALGGTRAESAFGASNPLRRMTVVLSIVFFLLASVLAIALSPKKSVTETAMPPKPGVSATVPITAGDDKDKKDDKEKAGDKPAPKGDDADKADKDKDAEKAGDAKPAPEPEKKPGEQ